MMSYLPLQLLCNLLYIVGQSLRLVVENVGHLLRIQIIYSQRRGDVVHDVLSDSGQLFQLRFLHGCLLVGLLRKRSLLMVIRSFKSTNNIK